MAWRAGREVMLLGRQYAVGSGRWAQGGPCQTATSSSLSLELMGSFMSIFSSTRDRVFGDCTEETFLQI